MKTNRLLLIFGVLTVLFLSGCSKPRPAAFFYPAEPAAPRIQHLKTFTAQSSFSSGVLKAVLGEETGYRLGRAMGAAFDNDKLYVVDAGKKSAGIAVFDFTRGKLDFLSGPLKKPIDIAIDHQGHKYVTDTILRQIVVFDSNNAFVKTYSPDIENFFPTGITIHAEQIYVTDIKKGVIYTLDMNSGLLIRETGADHKMFWPAKAAVNIVSNEILVLETGAAIVTAFDLQGNYLKNFGKYGDRPGSFARPKSIATDKNGLIYVVDIAFQNVQIFDESYNVLMAFGGPRTAGIGLVMPAGIALSEGTIPYFQQYADPDFTIEYLIAVTSQGAPGPNPASYSSVEIYGFGKKKGFDYSTSFIKEE